MNKKEPFVIALGREIGSGGHTVGDILARKLDVRYYDKQHLKALQKRFDLTAEGIERLKGEKKSFWSDVVKYLYPVPAVETFGLNQEYVQEYLAEPTSGEIFSAEVEILKGLAQLGSCVIAGRSGFFVFKDHPNKLSVFITASMPCRIERVMKKQGLTEKEAVDVINKVDQGRENYIQRCTGTSRYDIRNYDLVLNSDGHTEEQIADLILSYIDQG